MAEDNKDQKEQNNLLQSNYELTQKLRNATMRLNDETGGYKNILRDIKSVIKGTDDQYARIEARIKSYSDEVLNVKNLENEAFKSRQLSEKAIQKLNQLEKQRADFLQQGKLLTEDQVAIVEKEMQSMLKRNGHIKRGKQEEYNRLSILMKTTENMRQAVEAAEDNLRNSELNTKIVEEQAEIEKTLSKQLGVRTGLIQKIGKALGVEDEVRKNIIKTSRDGITIDEESRKISVNRMNILSLGYKVLKESLKDSFSNMSKGNPVLRNLAQVSSQATSTIFVVVVVACEFFQQLFPVARLHSPS